jgi:glycosyltransferase involved in cell wall biosynthesis
LTNIALSIITINLNNTIGLRLTIESVLAQTSRNFEFIVVDGGSTDGSVEVIREFADRITWWVSEPDNGIYQAMNKGIRAAKGEYCQFLNSGDWLVAPDVTERMLAAIPHGCAVFYGNMLKQMPGGRVLRDSCELGHVTMYTFFKGALNHAPAYIRRSLFLTYGLYDENLKIVSDWKWYVQVIGLHGEEVRYVNIDVVNFDMQGISSHRTWLEQDERKRVLEELVPVNIRRDYDELLQDIDRIQRINRNRLIRSVFRFTDRALFKWERMMNSLRRTK